MKNVELESWYMFKCCIIMLCCDVLALLCICSCSETIFSLKIEMENGRMQFIWVTHGIQITLMINKLIALQFLVDLKGYSITCHPIRIEML